MIKKLIEVALPLEKINAESAREKSIRHGHPSTLHLWWARRPLATARAVIWSSLVDDPSSHPEMFPTKEDQDKERQRLFRILEDLVVWENSNNEEVLNRAKAEILKYTDGKPPALLDPFAGGGSIPLEAQRLGLEAHAHDLNPVAVLINKAMIEIPPRFAGMPPVNPESRAKLGSAQSWKGAEGLAEDVRYYGEWMKQEAFRQIGHLYPKVEVPKDQGGGEATVIAWIWARTIKCPNPACGCTIPLASSFILSKKKDHEVWVKPIIKGKNIEFSVQQGKCPKKHESNKTGRSATFKCLFCGELTSDSYVKSYAKEYGFGVHLMATVAEAKNRRIFLSPDNKQLLASEVPFPSEYPSGSLPENPRWFSPPGFGLTEYYQLFTSRQLTSLLTFCNLIDIVREKVFQDVVSYNNTPNSNVNNNIDPLLYSHAVSTYLSFSIDKASNLWSTITGWMNDRGAFRETFARQAIPMVWDFAEANPFSHSGGNFSLFISRCSDAIKHFPCTNKTSLATQQDAQRNFNLENVMISTDPPYYDNIGYADLSDYFYIWLRHSLKHLYPSLFNTVLVPKAEELVATPFRFGGSVDKAKAFFEEGMLKTFKNIYRSASDKFPVSIYYAYKQVDSKSSFKDGLSPSSGWETMLSAIILSGFSITGTWPVRTESPGRSVAQKTNALASSIVLVCRKRPLDAPSTSRRAFINELHRILRTELRNLQSSNIAPVDLAQSAIGPGMAIFSKYSKVLEADGTSMTIRTALQIINQELDLYFNDQDGDLDSESRFCIDLYTQYAFNEMKYGEADTLARARNINISNLVNRRVLSAQKGFVRLLTREEISPLEKDNKKRNLKWDPASETVLWIVAQQLAYAMKEDGIPPCIEIITRLRGNTKERAKDLTYRLFTIADRKGWNQEAYIYNSLIVSWPEIESRAALMQLDNQDQTSLFEDL